MLTFNRSFAIRGAVRRLLVTTPFLWRYKGLLHPRFPGTAEYWESRYAAGGDSGVGSYGHLAAFKAEIVNRFIAQQELANVVELGCGDGAQLSLAQYPKYVGFDISPRAIEICRGRFAGDRTKSFFVYNPQEIREKLAYFAADLSISLDVIFHLVEDEIFEIYMCTLFSLSRKYVAIYSSNYDESKTNSHERHREFTRFVRIKFPRWRLYRKVYQRYQVAKYGVHNGSFSDFYFFEKT